MVPGNAVVAGRGGPFAAHRLTAPKELDVEMYHFANAKWEQAPFEGRHAVTYSVSTFNEHITFPAGTIVVRMNQRTARVCIVWSRCDFL